MFTFPMTMWSANAAFLPTSVSGLVGWYDGADTSTITIGTGVSQWNDKSGNANNATNSTGSSQPTYVANVQNGLHALQFNGTSQSLYVTIALGQPYSAFYVSWSQASSGSTSSGTYPSTVLELKNMGTGHLIGFHFSHFAGSQNLMSRFDGTTRTDTSYNASTAAEAFELRSDISDVASGKIYQSSTLEVTDSTVLASPNTSTQMQIGSEYGGNYLGGYLCELILYNRAVNSTEITELQNYLKTKWNTA